MKATKNRTVVYTIELSEKEAEMLKSLVQNPIADGEPSEWADFRLTVWDAITKAGE